MPANSIKFIVRRVLMSLARSKVPPKEKKRFKDIYNAVYRHARKNGQTHNQSLSYCWNVYAAQAPNREKAIVRNSLREKMTIDRKQIRKAIMEALEGEVINMSDYRPAEAPVEPAAQVAPFTAYETFLSEIHAQMLEFMEENFETLVSGQQVFLDEMLDILEDELGIEEEASFDFGDEDEEEVVADIEDED